MSEILFTGATLVDASGTRRADLLVRDSKIAQIGHGLSTTGKTIQADGLCLAPGLIDAHTHYHLVSRGTVTADSFAEGSRCAAFGGVTTVVDFADDDKHSGLAQCAQARIDAMSASMAVDFAIHQGVYHYGPEIPAQLSELKAKGVRAIKLFTTYKNVGYLIESRKDLASLFSDCKKAGLLVCVHCEDDECLASLQESWKGGYSSADHADLRPSEAEALAIEAFGSIALELDMSLYIVHLSSLKGLEAVRSLRKRGARLLVETTPHYLFLDRKRLEGPDGPLYVMTPPLRTKEDNLALQHALINGEIQVVATDHCSFTRTQKLNSPDVRSTYPGIPGTEEMFALMCTFAAGGTRLSLRNLVNLMSTEPAKLFGLYPNKGSLEIGSDADLVLFNPDEGWTLSADTTHSACLYTPYEGFEVTGKVEMVFLRGRMILGGGVYLGRPGNGEFCEAANDR
ncbi:MAG: amidohydrolase family protein [Sphaerochaetaceae bacterium]|nr:amidohydrolase family protein [Sphaerochaetaceae bacterium]